MHTTVWHSAVRSRCLRVIWLWSLALKCSAHSPSTHEALSPARIYIPIVARRQSVQQTTLRHAVTHVRSSATFMGLATSTLTTTTGHIQQQSRPKGFSSIYKCFCWPLFRTHSSAPLCALCCVYISDCMMCCACALMHLWYISLHILKWHFNKIIFMFHTLCSASSEEALCIVSVFVCMYVCVPPAACPSKLKVMACTMNNI